MMSDRFPSIEPVVTRGAFAQHEGPRRAHDEQRVLYLRDDAATFALVARGVGSARSGRPIADRIADLAASTFRERTSSMLDDLAEVWWRAEHGADAGARVRPFSSLPIGDRAELRARVKKLLHDRRPDALGDQAVLEAELARLLDLPAAVLRRAGKDIQRLAEERGGFHHGEGACVTAAIFAAGKATIAHVGDGRALLVRRGRLEALTHAHTLYNEVLHHHPDVTPEHLAQLPPSLVVRILGMPGDPHHLDVVTKDLERGDVFLLLTHGMSSFEDADVTKTVLTHGVDAAPTLVERGKVAFPGHTLENVAAVAIEIR
ncbi:MAG: hypothetical protein KIT84_43800 [Labilithrix sp.]|nr:hypothetical protein [Labilithrix sp.]MCW5818004.1 hypothetical protein [Labilithrix sp.]